MKLNRMRFLFLLLFAGLMVGIFAAAAGAQESADQNPLLLVKIPNIEKLLSDIQTLVPQDQTPGAAQQMGNIRMMLQGTDWIDTGRCIAVGLVLENGKTSSIALIPFLTPNDTFQNMYRAQPGADYYLVPLPPQPQFTVSPALERQLAEASKVPAAGSFVVEAAAGKILAIAEPLVAASLAKAEETQTAENPIPAEEMNAIMHEMFAVLKQAETLRLGLDFSGDAFTVIMDLEAKPGTDLAAALVETGSNSRLMNYPIDMPVKYYMRAYNIQGAQKLMQSYLGTVYSLLGLDINVDDIMQMSRNLTGEVAGGMDIAPGGLALKMAAVLQPGIDGDAFIRDSYLPLLENYSKKISEMAAGDADVPQTLSIERTADSTLDGVTIRGVKMHVQSPDAGKGTGLENIEMEMRLAAVKDLLYIAPSDAEIGKLIEGTRSLVPVPASGPTGRLVFSLSEFFNNLKSLIPAGQTPPQFPEDLKDITSYFELRDGKLSTRTSFDINLLKKLAASIAAGAAQGNQPGAREDNTGGPGTL